MSAFWPDGGAIMTEAIVQSTGQEGRISGTPDDTVLSVANLKTYFDTPAGIVKAVDDVSFDLSRTDILAIVGESGSGKSVTAQSIMKLIAVPPGRYAGGRIELEPSIPVQGSQGPSRVEADINGGGARLELQTSGGNIRIRLD